MIDTEDVHISQIRVGDTVIHDDQMRTVGKKDIKYSLFMGMSLWGDSYRFNHKKVKRVIWRK